MKILDLFCGLGGWAETFIKHGHEVTGYDVENFKEEYPGQFIQADLTMITPPGQFELVVASPPCTEFSKASFPKTWASVREHPPDILTGLLLFERAKEIISTKEPKYWVIENVLGAQKFVGKADFHIGSRYFWANLTMKPQQKNEDIYGKGKIPPSKNIPAIRSKIPKSIAEELLRTIERLEKWEALK